MMEPRKRMHSRSSRSVQLSHYSDPLDPVEERWEDMSRPKSMSDLQSLLDASAPLNGQGLPRKKPSISLAQGLMMTAESPRSSTMPDAPEGTQSMPAGGLWSANLFYAYAQKSDFAQSAPFVLTFASAFVADQWWAVVQREYPESTRPGPQLFILKGDDMQEQIQDNPAFYDLRNQWFYTPSDGATAPIPLQDSHGKPIIPPPPAKEDQPEQTSSFDMKGLEARLEQMFALISENTSSIRALSVAQSTGLQTMQEINESTSTQIKTLADNQAALQSIVSQNASHYIALSNSSFSTQNAIHAILQSNATHIAALAEGQKRMLDTCKGVMAGVEKMGEVLGGAAKAGSVLGSRDAERSVGAIVNRISPPPRKLNRKVKGVWYEYDDGPGRGLGGGGSLAQGLGSLRKDVGKMAVGGGPDTPPKSPVSVKTG